MTRPAVDVVVPFIGSDAERGALLERLGRIARGPHDTITVVDNRPDRGHPAGTDVLLAPARQSSYHARNRGAARGVAPWLLFLDADVVVERDLLDRYFDPEPAGRTGMLGGSVEPIILAGGGRVARYGVLRGHLAGAGASTSGHEYAITANLAVRRAAFEAVGGFADAVRSGGDADLSFRIRDAGWALERRPGARVSHPTRGSLTAMLRVFGRYGAGAQWLRRRYPGFAPPAPLWRQLLSLASIPIRVPVLAARGRHEDALTRAVDPLVGLAFDLGRFLPNERETGLAGVLRSARSAAQDRWGRR